MSVETARCELLHRLNATKTQAERNRLGQFATPEPLALEIVKSAISLLPPRSRLRFLEPGFGTGAFYSALLQTVSERRIERAEGFEIDPHYGLHAQELWQSTGLVLTLGDFMASVPPRSDSEKFNLVVCNPPYVRHHHLSQEQKHQVRQATANHTGCDLNGLSGLYAYFMVFSQAWMARGGVGAWLIPSEFMDVNYGRKVKEFLLDKVTLHQIHRCDPQEVQFDDALVSSAIVVFRNEPPSQEHRVRFSYGGSLTEPKVSVEIERHTLRSSGKWSGLVHCVPADTDPSETLASMFTIKRGLATGCNPFFILSSDDAERHKLPAEFLKPILPSPRYLEVDEVESGPDGLPRINRPLLLLSCDLPEEEVQRRHPPLWDYLQTGLRDGVHERYLCMHRSPWYSQEHRLPAPFLCTYMGRPTKRSDSPFRFILNHSKAVAANVYLMLYPKAELAAILREQPGVAKAVWKALSSITPEMLISGGRIYGGGLHKMEPKELASVAADVVWKALPGMARRRQKVLF
jgi:adenine-specific DNA-methyltransferase